MKPLPNLNLATLINSVEKKRKAEKEMQVHTMVEKMFDYQDNLIRELKSLEKKEVKLAQKITRVASDLAKLSEGDWSILKEENNKEKKNESSTSSDEKK